MLEPKIGKKRNVVVGHISAISNFGRNSKFFVCIGNQAFYLNARVELFNVFYKVDKDDKNVLVIFFTEEYDGNDFPISSVQLILTDPTINEIELAKNPELTPGTFSGLAYAYYDQSVA